MSINQSYDGFPFVSHSALLLQLPEDTFWETLSAALHTSESPDPSMSYGQNGALLAPAKKGEAAGHPYSDLIQLSPCSHTGAVLYRRVEDMGQLKLNWSSSFTDQLFPRVSREMISPVV